MGSKSHACSAGCDVRLTTLWRTFWAPLRMLLSLKTMCLLAPIAWTLLHGPKHLAVFVFGALFGIFDLVRSGNAVRLVRTWPIFLLVAMSRPDKLRRSGLSSLAGYVPSGVQPLPRTVSYAVPAGFCLSLWGRGHGQKNVLWGYLIFCLSLTAAGLFLVTASGPENLVHFRGNEIAQEIMHPAVVFICGSLKRTI